MLEGRAAVQKNFNKLEKWADRNFMKLNKDKCKCLSLPCKHCRLGSQLIRKKLCREGPGDLGGQQVEQTSCAPW